MNMKIGIYIYLRLKEIKHYNIWEMTVDNTIAKETFL